jgi:hypothetical protein
MRILYCILAAFYLLSGCKKAYIQFGDQFVDNGYTNIVLVDTLTPVVSTIFRDSVITSNSGIMLAGMYKDSMFGIIRAKTFFNLAPPALRDFSLSARYDSLRLILKSNGTYYGDTSTVQTISIYQLAEPIQIGESQSSLYNTSDFPIQAGALGSITRRFIPSDTSSILVPMSDALGQDLFNLLSQKSDPVKDITSFINYFKGLQIAPGPGISNAVLGFRDSVVMRLYYHEANPSPVNEYLDFIFNNQALQFNQIQYDRTGTGLTILGPANREAESTLTNNMAFVQSATGLEAKIRFPTLRNLLQRPDYAQILKAELDILPVRGSFSGQYPLPPELDLYSTSLLNDPLSPLTITQAGGLAQVQNGNLQVDWLYGQNTFYSYDVTTFLQQQIAISDNNKNGLLIQPPAPAFESALNRLVLGDSRNIKDRIMLKVYYISIQP